MKFDICLFIAHATVQIIMSPNYARLSDVARAAPATHHLPIESKSKTGVKKSERWGQLWQLVYN